MKAKRGTPAAAAASMTRMLASPQTCSHPRRRGGAGRLEALWPQQHVPALSSRDPTGLAPAAASSSPARRQGRHPPCT
jgi:hypothetical protein